MINHNTVLDLQSGSLPMWTSTNPNALTINVAKGKNEVFCRQLETAPSGHLMLPCTKSLGSRSGS